MVYSSGASKNRLESQSQRSIFQRPLKRYGARLKRPTAGLRRDISVSFAKA
jgi:hypothetical protein